MSILLLLRTVFFIYSKTYFDLGVVFGCTASSDDNCSLNIPVLKVYFPLIILYIFVDFYALSVFGIYLPQIEKLRETGGFF